MLYRTYLEFHLSKMTPRLLFVLIKNSLSNSKCLTYRPDGIFIKGAQNYRDKKIAILDAFGFLNRVGYNYVFKLNARKSGQEYTNSSKLCCFYLLIS